MALYKFRIIIIIIYYFCCFLTTGKPLVAQKLQVSHKNYYYYAVEKRKVRHVGRHGERHTGLVIRARDVPDTRRGSRGGAERKTNKYVTRSIILVCSSRGRNNGSH